MRPLALAAVLVLTALSASAKRGAQEKKMAASHRTYVLKGLFKCDLPAAWALDDKTPADAAEKTAGVAAVGPKDDGVPATLRVQFYASGNPHFADASDYVARQTDAEDRALSGDPAPQVEQIPFKGKMATRISRDTVEILPPKSLDAKKIPEKVETYVLARDGGFFVLELSASAKTFARRRREFQRLLDSFKPLER